MTETPKSEWLSAYLYYNEPWETFLVKAVEPYIKTVMQTGIAEQYFFIRYWDRGPHIRLRFKGDPKVVATILRPNLKEHFMSYFESKPSQRTEPNYPPSFPDHFKWLPNNSVVFMDYEPEIRRYGGAVGLDIAEWQFHAASDIALHCLKNRALNWSYDDALGTAIKLHLAFVSAVEMDIQEATSFFHFLYHNWLPRSFRYYHKKLTREAYIQQAEELTAAFAKSFTLQKDTLVPFHQVMWEALESDVEFEEADLNIWIKNNRTVHQRLAEAMEAQQLEERPPEEQYQLSNNAVVNAKRKLIWSFYGDYFHMTNNRLGILNRDEGFLAYLMMESLLILSRREEMVSE